MDAEAVRTLERDLAMYKVLLRVLVDVPEIMIDAFDMFYFGMSWWNALDVAFCTCMILY